MLRERLREAGRDVAEFGIDVRVDISSRTPDEWRREVEELRELEVTHITIDTQPHDMVLRDFDYHATRLHEGLDAIAAT